MSIHQSIVIHSHLGSNIYIFPSIFNHEGHEYHFIDKAIPEGKKGCYYMRDDSIVWRYYVNNGNDSKLIAISPSYDANGIALIGINWKYYSVAYLYMTTFHPDIPRSHYTLAA